MTIEEIQNQIEIEKAKLELKQIQLESEKLKTKIEKERAKNLALKQENDEKEASMQNNNVEEDRDYKEEFWKLRDDFLNNPEKILNDDTIKVRPRLDKAEDISEYLESYGGQDVRITKEMYDEIKKMYKEILINNEITKEKEKPKPVINDNMDVNEAIDELLKL